MRKLIYKDKYFEIIGWNLGEHDEQYFVNIETYNKGPRCIYGAPTIEECKEFIRNIDFDKYYF